MNLLREKINILSIFKKGISTLCFALVSLHLYQDITGCFIINILPSFAESRQIEVITWELLALLATAVSVLRKLQFAVCV